MKFKFNIKHHPILYINVKNLTLMYWQNVNFINTLKKNKFRKWQNGVEYGYSFNTNLKNNSGFEIIWANKK